jgi:hypothetical protein
MVKPEDGMSYQRQGREESAGKYLKDLRVSKTNMDAAHPSARCAPRPEKVIDLRRDLDTTLMSVLIPRSFDSLVEAGSLQCHQPLLYPMLRKCGGVRGGLTH